MKSSNLLLGLWCLVIFGIAFAVFFVLFHDRQTADPNNVPPVVVSTNPPSNTKTPTPLPVKPTPRANPVGKPTVRPEIGGRVVDAESKPLSGVTVSLLPAVKTAAPTATVDPDEVRKVTLLLDIEVEEIDSPRPLSSWTQSSAGDPARFGATPILTAETDAEGRFLFDVSRTGGQGPFRVVARSETLGSASRAGVRVGDLACDLQIATAGVVNGIVTAEAGGAAVPGCRLVFASSDREWSVTSGADGHFRIEDMPPGRYELRGGAVGFVPILSTPIVVTRTELVAVQLPRGVSMRVRAVISNEESGSVADGQPAANCDVAALEESTYAYVIGKTDSNGIVEFTGLPDGTWLVNGRGAGVVPISDERVTISAAKPQAEVVIEFEAAVETPIEVVDSQGQPVRGMTFFAGTSNEEYDALDAEKLPGVTDDRGNYKFAFEFMGRRARIFGFKPGFAAVVVAPEDYQDGIALRVVAGKAVRLHGVVRTPSGEPIPGAIVSITMTPPVEAASASPQAGVGAVDDAVYRILCNKEGRYDFANVPLGMAIMVEAETLDGSYSDESEDLEANEDHELNFTIDLEDFTIRGAALPGVPVPPKKDGAAPPMKSPVKPPVKSTDETDDEGDTEK